jgi:hypothetical protein
LDEHWQGRTIAMMRRHAKAGDIGASRPDNANFVGIKMSGALYCHQGAAVLPDNPEIGRTGRVAKRGEMVIPSSMDSFSPSGDAASVLVGEGVTKCGIDHRMTVNGLLGSKHEREIST